MENLNLIGYTASALTIASIIPQVFKTIKTRDVSSFSTYSLFFLILAQCTWTLYGVLLSSGPVTIINGLMFLGAFCVLWLKHNESKN